MSDSLRNDELLHDDEFVFARSLELPAPLAPISAAPASVESARVPISEKTSSRG